MSHPVRLPATTGRHLSTMYHYNGASHNVHLARIPVNYIKHHLRQIKMCHFATNESDSYWGNFITAPNWRQLLVQLWHLHAVISMISVWAAVGMTVILVPCPDCFQKQLGGTTLNWWPYMADDPKMEIKLLFVTVIQANPSTGKIMLLSGEWKLGGQTEAVLCIRAGVTRRPHHFRYELNKYCHQNELQNRTTQMECRLE